MGPIFVILLTWQWNLEWPQLVCWKNKGRAEMGTAVPFPEDSAALAVYPAVAILPDIC